MIRRTPPTDEWDKAVADFDDIVGTNLRPSQVAELMLDVVREGPTGRSGDNIGLWVGHPPALSPPGPTALRQR